MNAQPDAREHRVLVLPPLERDGRIAARILAAEGLHCHVCRDLAEMTRETGNGAAALLLSEEALLGNDAVELRAVLQAQPAWSDLPVLLLASGDQTPSIVRWATGALRNVTLLDRPTRTRTLVSALHAAVGARRRQYQLREQIAALHASEQRERERVLRLRLLAHAAGVVLAADDAAAMIRTLFDQVSAPLGLDVYCYCRRGEDDDEPQLASCSGFAYAQAGEMVRLESGRCTGGDARGNDPLVLADIGRSDDPAVAPLKAAGVDVYASFRLATDGQLFGTLGFGGRRAAFEAEEIAFLATLSRYVTLAHERQRLIGSLRESDRRKDLFLATLAHELRNPLTPIVNSLAVLRIAGAGALERTRPLMERQAAQLTRLLDDLLDVSRITSGKLRLRTERVELGTVLKSAIETASPLIQQHRHTLVVDLPPQGVLLDADPVRLAQVFANLINNAAKYMQPGGRIAIGAEPGADSVTVRVRDWGIGIAPAALTSIFEPFMQAEAAIDEARGGLGLGLALVRQLVELHGGRVEARSEGEGRGSEFVVQLPTPSQPAKASPA